MTTKQNILDNIKKNIPTAKYDMPSISSKIKGIQYDDKVTQFIQVLESVGGKALLLEKGKDINEAIKGLYPDAKTIVSPLKEITITNKDINLTAKEYDNTDLGIVRGEVGVAENAAIWITQPEDFDARVINFISENLIIVLEKEKLVNNMHEGYKFVEDLKEERLFGVFMSGPSKTADIEQALVIGAHGPKEVLVILI